MDFLNRLKLIIILLFVISNISCNNALRESRILSTAQNNVNEYYYTNDTLLLDSAENELSKIPDNKKGITLRLIIYNIKKDYDNALNLVEKTDNSDFGKTYMKYIYLNYYKALLSKNQLQKREYSDKAISCINDYINKHPSDMEAFAEKINLISVLYSNEQAISEIDSAIVFDKYDVDFLSALKESLLNVYLLPDRYYTYRLIPRKQNVINILSDFIKERGIDYQDSNSFFIVIESNSSYLELCSKYNMEGNKLLDNESSVFIAKLYPFNKENANKENTIGYISMDKYTFFIFNNSGKYFSIDEYFTISDEKIELNKPRQNKKIAMQDNNWSLYFIDGGLYRLNYIK